MRPWAFWLLYSAHLEIHVYEMTFTSNLSCVFGPEIFILSEFWFTICFLAHFYTRLPVFMKILLFFDILIDPNSKVVPWRFLSLQKSLDTNHQLVTLVIFGRFLSWSKWEYILPSMCFNMDVKIKNSITDVISAL